MHYPHYAPNLCYVKHFHLLVQHHESEICNTQPAIAIKIKQKLPEFLY